MRQGDGKLWEEFTKNVHTWLEHDFVRLLDLEDRTPGFYIPSFIVVRLDKSTTQYRMVVNASYPFEGGVLNEMLLPGHNLMNNLYDVLIRFRSHRYVLTGDISKMFLSPILVYFNAIFLLP